MAKREGPNFVVTFLLKTEPWQEDRINKMMRMLTVLYNEKQEILLKRYIHLSHTPEFKEAKQNKNAFKKFMGEQGFSEYGILTLFSKNSKTGSISSEQLDTHGLNTRIVQELSNRAWSAWEKKLFGKGKFISTDNKVNTFKSRIMGGNIIGFKYSTKEAFTITMSAEKPKRHKMFTIPFVVNKDSEYELFAMHQEVRNIAITRKEIRGKYKYFVQFTLAGTPYNKGRQLGTGVVGIDPGPSKIAVVSDKEVVVIPLAASIVGDERLRTRYQRKLDRSRRATNPEKYNDDGTINKNNKEPFIKSNHYKETQGKLADIQRKLAAKRKIAHNELANEVLAMGNEFHVENNSFRGMQKRTEETKQNAKGKFVSKKRFGKSLANHAPSEFLTILENKVKQYPEGKYCDIPSGTACTQYDFTNGAFTKHELKERTITTSDGRKHDRDLLAAFNMKFARIEKLEGKNKEKSESNFDNEAMAAFYKRFCQMEKDKFRELYSQCER